MNSLKRINLKNNVEKILHIPYNFKNGMFEFAIVFDYHVPKDILKKQAKEIIELLRTIRYKYSKDGVIMSEDIFKNARLNIIEWISDDKIIKSISTMGMVQIGRCFENYRKYEKFITDEKTLDELTLQLKKFYARSKLIIIITDKSYKIDSQESVNENFTPFLRNKLIYVYV